MQQHIIAFLLKNARGGQEKYPMMVLVGTFLNVERLPTVFVSLGDLIQDDWLAASPLASKFIQALAAFHPPGNSSGSFCSSLYPKIRQPGFFLRTRGCPP